MQPVILFAAVRNQGPLYSMSTYQTELFFYSLEIMTTGSHKLDETVYLECT